MVKLTDPRLFVGATVAAFLGTAPLAAQDSLRVPGRNFQAKISESHIVASQGQDESFQSIAVAIWGQPRTVRLVSGQFNADPELEYLVISRSAGSGPYYRMQIIASRPFGIFVWSYPSCGAPRIEPPRIALGVCAGEAGAAGTAIPMYSWYRLTDGGLELEAQRSR
jgi:hypothetical protein